MHFINFSVWEVFGRFAGYFWTISRDSLGGCVGGMRKDFYMVFGKVLRGKQKNNVYKQNYIIKGCSKKKKNGIAWRAPDMKRSRHKIFTSFYSVPEHQNQLYAQKQGLDGMASGRP